MPHSVPPPFELQQQIATLCELMIESRQFAEAECLARVGRAPEACADPEARPCLLSAGAIIRDLGFPEVASWLDICLGRETQDAKFS